MRANTVTILAVATGAFAAPQHGAAGQYDVSSSSSSTPCETPTVVPKTSSTPCETPTSSVAYETRSSSSAYTTPEQPATTPCEETPVPTTTITPCDETPVPTVVVPPTVTGNWTEPSQHTGPVVVPTAGAADMAVPVFGSLAAVAVVNVLFL